MADRYLVSSRKPFLTQVLHKFGYEARTLAGAVTLTKKTSQWLALDPGGATRVVTLPAFEDGLWFKITNSADGAGEALTISDGSTVATLSPGECGFFVSDGSDWYLLDKSPAVEAAQGLAIADPGDAGAIPVTDSGVCAMTSAGAETRTLAIPTFIGQRLTLVADTYVGDIVVTAAAPFNVANNNTLTFGAVSEACELVAVSVGGALVWQIGFNDGVAPTTV